PALRRVRDYRSYGHRGALHGAAGRQRGAARLVPALSSRHRPCAVDGIVGSLVLANVLGAKEAFTFRDERGRPFSYLQSSVETRFWSCCLRAIGRLGLRIPVSKCQTCAGGCPNSEGARLQVTDLASDGQERRTF